VRREGERSDVEVTNLTRLLSCDGENWIRMTSEFWQESDSMTMPTAIAAERTKKNPARTICKTAATAMPQPQLTAPNTTSTIIIKIDAANAPISAWSQIRVGRLQYATCKCKQTCYEINMIGEIGKTIKESVHVKLDSTRGHPHILIPVQICSSSEEMSIDIRM